MRPRIQQGKEILHNILGRAINTTADRVLHKMEKVPTQKLIEQSQQLLPQIRDIYAAQAFYWHGTGRYHYENGKQKDVLIKILEENGLAPHRDVYDMATGNVNSTSFAFARMYARIYAELHATEKTEPEYTYGSRKFWAAKFIGETTAIGLQEMAQHVQLRSLIRNPRSLLNKLKTSNQEWTAKLRSDTKDNPQTSIQVFSTLHSDIPENYPILLGIKKDGFTPSATAGYINKHEKRTRESVSINAFTHIEVPLDNIEETKAILKQYNIDIPVLPIECGELYCSHFSFADLTKGGYLREESAKI